MGTINVKIKYDGEWPCLCGGHLEVWVNDVYYDFENWRLSSGGRVTHDEDWNFDVEEGPWSIDFPEDFPEEYKEAVLREVNTEIPYGCCGGCI